jgi:hypothetical protein
VDMASKLKCYVYGQEVPANIVPMLACCIYCTGGCTSATGMGDVLEDPSTMSLGLYMSAAASEDFSPASAC